MLPQDIAQLLPKGKLLSEVRTLISFGGRSVGKQFFSSLSAALLSAASCLFDRSREEAAATGDKMIDFFPRRCCFVQSSMSPAEGGRGSKSTSALLCISSWRTIAPGRRRRRRRKRSEREREGGGNQKLRSFFQLKPRDLDLDFFSLTLSLSSLLSLSLPSPEQNNETGRVAGHRRAAVPRLGPLRHPQAGAAREYSSFSLSSFFSSSSSFFVFSAVAGFRNSK